MRKPINQHVTDEIGIRIRSVRHAKGLTQKQVAEAIGVTYQQFHKYETGINQVSVPFLMKIANFFVVPITDFIPDSTGDYEAPASPQMTNSVRRLLILFNEMSTLQQEQMIAFARVVSDQRFSENY